MKPPTTHPIGLGEPPPIHEQVCRTTGQSRAVCTCPKCLKACQRIIDETETLPPVAEAQVTATEDMARVRLQVGAVPDFPESLAESLERAER